MHHGHSHAPGTPGHAHAHLLKKEKPVLKPFEHFDPEEHGLFRPVRKTKDSKPADDPFVAKLLKASDLWNKGSPGGTSDAFLVLIEL